MLNIILLREQPEFVRERLLVKNFDATGIIGKINSLDQSRRVAQTELDSILAEQNSIAREVGMLMKSGKKEEAEAAKAKVAALKEESKSLESKMNDSANEMNDLLVQLPNLPHTSVPLGKLPTDNVVVKEGGEIPKLTNALPHWELARKYDIIDFDLGDAEI